MTVSIKADDRVEFEVSTRLCKIKKSSNIEMLVWYLKNNIVEPLNNLSAKNQVDGEQANGLIPNNNL